MDAVSVIVRVGCYLLGGLFAFGALKVFEISSVMAIVFVLMAGAFIAIGTRQKHQSLRSLGRKSGALNSVGLGDRDVDGSAITCLSNDYLGQAAMLKAEARQAEAQGNFDAAWGYYQKQKECYLKHAGRSGFTREQALSLDASVHESLANILRLEGKHYDALVHVLYWISASSRLTRAQEKKLPAYFNRCKFEGVSLDEAKDVAFGSGRLKDFVKIRDLVSEWKSRAC